MPFLGLILTEGSLEVFYGEMASRWVSMGRRTQGRVEGLLEKIRAFSYLYRLKVIFKEI